MLKAYDIAVAALKSLAPVAACIGRHDRDLAKQLRNAMNSVVLNIAEGSHARGGRRNTHYTHAMGSGREVLAALDAAKGWGYVPDVPEHIDDALRHVVAILYKNVGSHR